MRSTLTEQLTKGARRRATLGLAEPTEVAVTTNPDYSPVQGEPVPTSVEELARHKGIEHVKTIEQLACDGVFDTDEEVEQFLAFVTEQRHANLA